MIKYSFYKVSTMFSNRNGTMERDFLPRPKTWKTVRQTRNQDEDVKKTYVMLALYSFPNYDPEVEQLRKFFLSHYFLLESTSSSSLMS